MRRVLASLMLLVIALPFAAANHSQSEGGRIVVFDHRTGNEWWVEVILTGQDAGSVAEVWAMDGLDPWTRLEKKSWGAYAASFHIEAGKMVRFKAVWAGGVETISCYFTHPGGVERCDMPPTPTPTPTTFDASFSNVKGNDWWVEAKVTANQPLATVHARVDCAATWKALTLRSWGHWAASFHVPPGSRVDFLVTSTRGDQDTSGAYTWPQGTPTTACGTSTPTPTPTTFDATFSNVKGNDWWVEAKVTGNQAVSAVEARVDCTGAWKPLTLRSWGAWAASIPVPYGSKVDLRARSSSGMFDLSSGYVWPDAMRAAGCFTSAWPVQGSFAEYHIEAEEFARDPETGDTYHFIGGGTERITWDAVEGWQVVCEFVSTLTIDPADGPATTENMTHSLTDSYPAPRGPLEARVGETVVVESTQGCFFLESWADVIEQAPRETGVHNSTGVALVVNGFHAETSQGESTERFWWEPKLGLTFEWAMLFEGADGNHNFRLTGDLVDTDAAI